MNVQIIMVTCEREPSYVHETIESMISQDPTCLESHRIEFVICGTSSSFLDKWSSRFRYKANTISEENFQKLPQDKIRRILHTMMRAASIALRRPYPIILLQDDLEFAKNWLDRTIQAVGEIRDRRIEDFVMSLYAPYELFSNRAYVEYPERTFYGNQALYLPHHICYRLLRFMISKISIGEIFPDDMMVKNFLLSDPFYPLFSVYPNVVQHIGENSTIDSQFHQSPTFGSAF